MKAIPEAFVRVPMALKGVPMDFIRVLLQWNSYEIHRNTFQVQLELLKKTSGMAFKEVPQLYFGTPLKSLGMAFKAVR